MRAVEQLDVCYSNDDEKRCSVFAGINTYDEDFAVMVLQEELTDQIDELVKDAEVFNIDALKRMYPDGLDRPYNAIIILDRLIYDGAVQEVQNERFGFFKFLGVFDSD